MQILLKGVAPCYPLGAKICLSAEHTWRQLVPDLAALVRTLCVALDAWPRDVPKPDIFGVVDPQTPNLHTPLGLQVLVRRALLVPFCFCANSTLVSSPPGGLPSCKHTSLLLDRLSIAHEPTLLNPPSLAARAMLCGAVRAEGGPLCGGRRARRVHRGDVRGGDERPAVLDHGERACPRWEHVGVLRVSQLRLGLEP